MSIDVMKRYEYKYIIDEEIYEQFEKEIEAYVKVDEYNKIKPFYTITNMYYDTRDNYLINMSLSKPIYKEKLRIRSYGVPTLESVVFLEIKKKFKGVVNKRRTKIVLKDAYEFLSGNEIEVKDFMNEQVVKELEFFKSRYDLIPKLFIAYDRRAYFGDNGLRITFDKNIRTRRYDLNIEYGDHGEYILPEGKVLVEIKSESVIPIWLSRILSEHKIYSTSFSKYGTEYKKYLRERIDIRNV